MVGSSENSQIQESDITNSSKFQSIKNLFENKKFPSWLPAILLAIALPLTVFAAMSRQNSQNFAATLSSSTLASVEVEPQPEKGVKIKIGEKSIAFSALGYDASKNPMFSGVTYEWGMSSISGIGTLTKTTGDITEFIPKKIGRGVIYVIAKQGTINVTKTIQVIVTDNQGNLPPSVTLTINSGAPTFIDPLLNLTITPSIDPSKVKFMQFSQDGGTTWTDWEPFSQTKQLALPPDAVWGDRTVIVEIKDQDGNLAQASATATYVSANKASMQLITNYSFIADLNYPAATINTVQTVNITNTSGDWLSTFNFSVPPQAFGEFNLTYVKEKVSGRDLSTTWKNNSNLVVDFGKNIRKNDSVIIEMSFKDTAHPTLTELDSRLSKANGVLEVSQWFPIISNGHPTRNPTDSQYTLVADNFHLELTMNTSMPFAAPGTISSPTTKKRVVDFGPARDFAFSVCPSCKSVTGTAKNPTPANPNNKINVKVYYVPNSTNTNGGTALNNAISSLETFNKQFAPYPYPNFVVAQSTKFTDEYPGLIFVGKDKLTNLDYVRHETAHQWFYGMLGNDQINEPWLDEAFAEWAGLGFAAHKYDSTLPVNSNGNDDFPDVSLWSNLGAHNSYFQTIYYKGASFIDGVRKTMTSDTVFYSSMKNLFANNKFGVITTQDVIKNWLDYADKIGKKAALTNYMQKFINW